MTLEKCANIYIRKKSTMCVCMYVCLYFNLSIHTYVSGLRKWESLRVPLAKPEKFTENQERADEFATDNSYLTSYGLTI